jgi:ABC-type nitrate/sulfonate/bicarbonate transport system substrate-binding protein
MSVPAKSLAFLPYYVGVEKGIFEAEGIILEMPLMASNLAVASMAAGEIHYTSSTASSIQAAMTGSPIKVVSFMLRDLAFSIMAAPEISSPAELRGKAIAVTNLTAADDYAWRAVVRAHGVSPDDVTAVATGTTANSLAALASGGVAAAVLSPPSDDIAERQGYHSIGWAADYLKRAQSGLATTDRRLQEAPDEVKRMIRATLRSMHHTLDNEADAVGVIMREYSVAPDLAPATYQKIVRVMGRDGEVSEEAIREEIADTKARTGVTADVPLSQVMDLSLLRQVRAEMGMR